MNTETIKVNVLGFLRKHFIGWKTMLLQAALFSGFFAFCELFFHINECFEVTGRIAYPLLFSIPLGIFCTAFVSFFPRKVNCIISTVIASVSSIWFLTQIIYSSVFQDYMDFAKVTMAGDVAAGFGNEMIEAIIIGIPRIIAFILITLVFSLVLFIYIRPEKKSPVFATTGIIVCLLVHLLCKGTLAFGGTGHYSPSNMYDQYPRVLENNIQNFGVITALRLELCDIVFGNEESGDELFETLPPNIDDLLGPGTDTDTDTDTDTNTGTDTDSETGPDIPLVPVKEKNELDIDFDALLAQSGNKTINQIHQYVAAQSPSNTNKYTGMFEGYNLITICAESFSHHMISKDLTPTLYKMYSEGFVFTNFYSSFKSVTTNGEYAFCTGLIPNTVGSTDTLKKDSTFDLSVGKYLPYTMGNVFKDMGASTFAYHGNVSTMYGRGDSHPNMGYDLCRFMDGSVVNGTFTKDNPLTFSNGKLKPTSDSELAQQTVGDYLVKDEFGNVKQFHAYYMTYSGHHPYHDIHSSAKKNPMVYEHRELVDDLPYSEVVKSYIACNLEVEAMVTILLEELEKAGCLENTVIAISNDHFPYGLSTSSFNQLAGEKMDTTFEMYKNAFLLYSAGMKERVVVDTPCCTFDIIPTLLNLFGVDYDSRLLAGTDILDDKSFHIAMLSTQNFITDKIKYNTSKQKITYLVDKSEVSDAYVDACVAYVKNKFQMSLQIISNDYYRVIYDHLDAQQAAVN